MDNAFKRDVSGTLMVWFKAGNKFTKSIEYRSTCEFRNGKEEYGKRQNKGNKLES